MQKSLMKAGSYVATALMFALALSQAAHAEPVSKDTLRRYFDISKTASLSDSAVETISAAQAKAWKEETKPDEKAKKKAIYDKTDAIIRKYINWPAIEPLAIDSYQKNLSEAEVQELIGHAQGPAGQIIINKLTPAMLRQLPAVAAHLEKRFEAISEQKAGTPAPALLPQPPAANPKEALARTLMLDMPGARAEFDAHMGSLEEKMLQSVAMFAGGESASIADEMKRLAALLKEQVKFEEIVTIKARMITDDLSEADITALIEDNKQPARRAQIIKLKQADAELQKRMMAYLQETIFPQLLPELMKIIGKE